MTEGKEIANTEGERKKKLRSFTDVANALGFAKLESQNGGGFRSYSKPFSEHGSQIILTVQDIFATHPQPFQLERYGVSVSLGGFPWSKDLTDELSKKPTGNFLTEEQNKKDLRSGGYTSLLVKFRAFLQNPEAQSILEQALKNLRQEQNFGTEAVEKIIIPDFVQAFPQWQVDNQYEKNKRIWFYQEEAGTKSVKVVLLSLTPYGIEAEDGRAFLTEDERGKRVDEISFFAKLNHYRYSFTHGPVGYTIGDLQTVRSVMNEILTKARIDSKWLKKS